MGKFNKIDILTYAAISVSVVCLAVTGYMQYNIGNSVKTLENINQVSEYVSDAAQEFKTEDVNSAEPASEITVREISTTVQPTTETATTVKSTKKSGYNTAVPKASRGQTKANNSQKESGSQESYEEEAPKQLDSVFVYSKNSKKLHSRSCPYAAKIKDENKMSISDGEAQQLLDNGYSFCSYCMGYIIED